MVAPLEGGAGLDEQWGAELSFSASSGTCAGKVKERPKESTSVFRLTPH